MKIYVITKGANDCYRVITATTDYKLAEALVEKFSDAAEKACIEEFPLAEDMMKPCWRAVFDKQKSLVGIARVDTDGEYEYANLNKLRQNKFDGFTITVSADNAIEAIEIAQKEVSK